METPRTTQDADCKPTGLFAPAAWLDSVGEITPSAGSELHLGAGGVLESLNKEAWSIVSGLAQISDGWSSPEDEGLLRRRALEWRKKVRAVIP